LHGNQNIWEQRVVTTDGSIGASELLGAYSQAVPQNLWGSLHKYVTLKGGWVGPIETWQNASRVGWAERDVTPTINLGNGFYKGNVTKR